MEILKLAPVIKRPVWSGAKIAKWNKRGCDGKIGETWELSLLPNENSRVDGGEHDGKTLSQVLTRKEWGRNADKFDKFPMLVKFIDASDNLSVQVHPTTAYAKEKGLINGKTEAWYVLDCDLNAGLYLGFNKQTCLEEVRTAMENGTITNLLNFVKVKKGDCFFVPGGTVHAIGAGVTVAEIQQSSDVTFRVYDYGRLGVDGKPRELHQESALDCMDYSQFKPVSISDEYGSLVSDKKMKKLADCEYFTFYENDCDNIVRSKDSFLCVICVDGNGKINGYDIKKGESYFVPADEQVSLNGKMRTLIAGVGV